MFFRYRLINQKKHRLLLPMLLFCSPLFGQVLTGTLGLRGGFCHNVLYGQENELWVGAGHGIGLEIGINFIPQLELIGTIAHLTTKYTYENDEVIYYKSIKEYTNWYVPLRLRLNLFTIRYFKPNIEFGIAITQQYSGFSQLEWRPRQPINQNALETYSGLLYGCGCRIFLIRHLSLVPGFHYQKNFSEDKGYSALFSIGITYGD